MFYYFLIIGYRLSTDEEHPGDYINELIENDIFDMNYIASMFRKATFDLDDVVDFFSNFQSGVPGRDGEHPSVNEVGVRFVKDDITYSVIEYLAGQAEETLPHNFSVPLDEEDYVLRGRFELIKEQDKELPLWAGIPSKFNPNVKHYKFEKGTGEYFKTEIKYTGPYILAEILDTLFRTATEEDLIHYFAVFHNIFRESNREIVNKPLFEEEIMLANQYRSDRQQFLSDFNEANDYNLKIIEIEDDGRCLFRAISCHPAVKHNWEELQARVGHTLWGGDLQDILILENFLKMNICMIYRGPDGKIVHEAPRNPELETIYLYDYSADPHFKRPQRHFDLVLFNFQRPHDRCIDDLLDDSVLDTEFDPDIYFKNTLPNPRQQIQQFKSVSSSAATTSTSPVFDDFQSEPKSETDGLISEGVLDPVENKKRKRKRPSFSSSFLSRSRSRSRSRSNSSSGPRHDQGSRPGGYLNSWFNHCY